MINPLIEKEIFAQVNKLSDEQQQQVLDFARFLAMKNPVGVPGKDLLKFAGTISHEDAKIMLEAAQENWGQADLKGEKGDMGDRLHRSNQRIKPKL